MELIDTVEDWKAFLSELSVHQGDWWLDEASKLAEVIVSDVCRFGPQVHYVVTSLDFS